MRSYRKCYRTADFRTVFATAPPGYSIANPGTNAESGQVAKMMFKVGSMFEGKPYFAISLYNQLASAPVVMLVDQGDTPGDCTTWNILSAVNGLTFANIVFDLQFYSDHPLN